ncbi:type II toxin-antitoxin system VapC family toxin [Amycolatopsis thailandensis]|uniref:type II toxin-antitoxin system VapC family toxin n=1 Tax=Amycolatopsis thailandensis TaxID=589330 RepID=UPI0037A33156
MSGTGGVVVADRPESGVLDTCAYVDLGRLNPAVLPVTPELTVITMTELHQGVAMAKDTAVRAARMEKLGAAIADFVPLPFGGDAAARYGTLVALVLAANRDPRPRRTELMIAAIASSKGLPLYTRSADGFKDLGSMVEVVSV